jgi:hypothetical protein
MPKRKTAKKRAAKTTKKRFFFLPYPVVLLLLLASGLLLLAWTFKVSATDVLVTARIQGPAIASPATIENPADGTHFSAVPITVTGSCPPNAAYVEIFRNNFMGSSALCGPDGKYEVQTDLFADKNELTVHSFNITDDEGPVSDKVVVYYDVPQPPASNPNQAPGGAPSNGRTPNKNNVPPLILKTAFLYKGYYVNQQIDWPIEISGGSAPYAFSIDWGDGSSGVISRKDAGQFSLNHAYKKPGGYKDSYKISVQASDTDGSYAYLEFFVIVNNQDKTALINSINSKPPPSLNNFRHLLWVAWPAYASVTLMTVTFKLGERQELMILKRRGLLRRS